MKTLALAACCLAVGFSACRTPSQNPRDAGSQTKDLFADTAPQTRNIGMVVAARVLSEGDMREYPTIIAKMKASVGELSGDPTFEVKSSQRQTKANIIDGLERAARDAGTNGTIFWYVASHGRSGQLRSYDAQTIEPSELVDALRRGRQFGDQFVPIRRLYMIFDFCESDASANTISKLAVPPPLPLSDFYTVHDSDSDAVKIVQAFRTSIGTGDSGTAAAFDNAGVARPIASQMLLYAVAATGQSTYGMTFLTAFGDALAEIKNHRDITFGEFFTQVTENIAALSQSTLKRREQYPVPQRAILYAYPENSLLKEKVYGGLTATWENSVAPCPKFSGYDWNFAHGRDLTGECIDPKQYCSCSRVIDANKNDICKMSKPGTNLSWVQEPSDEDARINGINCYKTCDQIAIHHDIEFLKQCNGQFIVRNPVRRNELVDLRPLLSEQAK